MTMDGGPVLRLEGVRKSYGDAEVLRGIDLEVAAHEVVCLIGASGCGKSTLLKCANQIEPVSDGRIFFGGEEITAPDVDLDAVRRRIVIVFQAFNLFPHMNVLSNVTLAPRRVLGMPRPAAEERRASCSRASGWATRRASTRTGCRAASSSARPSSARWPCSRSSCCSTRSQARSIPSWSARS